MVVNVTNSIHSENKVITSAKHGEDHRSSYGLSTDQMNTQSLQSVNS